MEKNGKKVVVIDGQGGKMGAMLIAGLKARALPCVLFAIGTNSIATASMLKAGAAQGATGENPVKVACRDADVIAGPLGILIADSLLGEITPAMAAAVGQSAAQRVLLPVSRCNTHIAGAASLPAAQLIAAAVDAIAALL